MIATLAGLASARTLRWRDVLPLAGLIAAVVVALAAVALTLVAQHERAQVATRLAAIADLRAERLGRWRTERIAEAAFVRGDAHFAALLGAWQDAGDAQALARLRARLSDFSRQTAAAAVFVLDSDGVVLDRFGDATATADTATLAAAARAALADDAVRMSGFDAPVAGHAPRYVDVVAPLSGGGVPRGAVVLRMDLLSFQAVARHLWAAYGGSGETVIARRAGAEVIYLCEHDEANAVTLRAHDSTALAVRVLRGEVPFDAAVPGRDRRGVAVIGVAHRVPGSDWVLVSQLERSAINARILAAGGAIGTVALLVFLLALGVVSVLLQRRALGDSARARARQQRELRGLRLLNALAEASPDVIFAKDREGRYLLFNPAAGRLTGKVPEAMLGRDDRELFPPQEAATLRANDVDIMRENRVETREETLTTALGRITFSATKGPLRDDHGNVIGLFGISRDITERRCAEQALAASRDRLAFALAAGAMGAWEWDVVQDLLYWSAEVYDIFALPRPADPEAPLALADFLA
ncbi:MAG: PAS domain-containing protein, partial [Gammaproteobacteria bacterium]